MRLALTLHPDSRCASVSRIEVEVVRGPSDRLLLRYLVTGAIDDLLLPQPGILTRCDALWEHSCFEMFLRPAGDASYYEFNFAPSMQWAAYGFDGYRSGMRVAEELSPPEIEARAAADLYELRVALTLPDLPGDVPSRIGLSAVIEEASGRKSYWALAHSPGKADFHHSDSFAHQLSAA